MVAGRTKNRLPKLMQKHGGRCVYCGCEVAVRKRQGRRLDDATIDHVIPYARGGTDAWTNLVLACRECNESKGDGPALVAQGIEQRTSNSQVGGSNPPERATYDCETCQDDPIECAKVPGLRHCEKATREVP